MMGTSGVEVGVPLADGVTLLAPPWDEGTAGELAGVVDPQEARAINESDATQRKRLFMNSNLLGFGNEVGKRHSRR